MIRDLYRFLLRLHPRNFRSKFGDEMLSIFDQSKTANEELQLLGDGVNSLLRQRVLRSNTSFEGPAAAFVTDVPMFQVMADEKLQPSRLIHGVMLSLLMFAAVTLLINLGKIRPPHRVFIKDVGQTAPSIPGISGASVPQPWQPDVEPSGSFLSTRVIQPVPVPEELLKSYAGAYELENSINQKIVITFARGQLSMTFPGNRQTALIPVSPSRFVPARYFQGWVEFVRGDELLISFRDQQSKAFRQPQKSLVP